MLNNLTGIPWKQGTGPIFFAVHWAGDGSNEKFASGKKETFSDFIHVTGNSSR